MIIAADLLWITKQFVQCGVSCNVVKLSSQVPVSASELKTVI